MKILDDIISTLSIGKDVNQIVIGVHATMVVTRHGGLASTFQTPCPQSKHKNADLAGAVNEMDGHQLLELAASSDLLEASIGMAALNSMIETPPEKNVTDQNALDIILEKGTGKNIAVVGQFPFVHKIADAALRFELIQAAPDRGLSGVEKARQVFPEMDVIAITGSSFINHTFETLIRLTENAYTVVLGGTTPMSTVLFDYGADALCGTVVSDVDTAAKWIQHAASFRFLNGIRRVTWRK